MRSKQFAKLLSILVLLSLVLAACAQPAAPTTNPPANPTQASAPEPTEAPVAAPVEAQPAQTEPAAGEGEFDLEALIEAAKAEGEVVIYWHSSRFEKAGELFTAKYGIKVNGTKMNDAEQTERIVREVDSGNVQVDLIGYDDGGNLVTNLIPNNYATVWVPPDLKDVIPAVDQDPLIYLWQPRIWGYNTEAYPDGCPITNVWQLTEEDWRGKVIIRDPQVTTAQLGYFAGLIENADLLEQAYLEHTGEALVTEEENAGWEYIKRLITNDLVLMESDDDVSSAVGSAGQTDPPIGLYTYAKHRNMEENNLHLGLCLSMKPYAGYALPTFVAQVTGAKHPNAAKLFTHFVLTEEGVAPWAIEDLGGYSSNTTVGVHPQDEVGSFEKWREMLVTFDPGKAFQIRQDVLDFWLLNIND